MSGKGLFHIVCTVWNTMNLYSFVAMWIDYLHDPYNLHKLLFFLFFFLPNSSNEIIHKRQRRELTQFTWNEIPFLPPSNSWHQQVSLQIGVKVTFEKEIKKPYKCNYCKWEISICKQVFFVVVVCLFVFVKLMF